MDASIALKFARAADQRLTAAEWLLRNGAFNIDSMYLAGYAVECALKALLLRRTPARKQQNLVSRLFRGRQGHNLELLKRHLARAGCLMPASLFPDFSRVLAWSTDIRYEVGLGNTEEAQQFLTSARRLRDWAKRS